MKIHATFNKKDGTLVATTAAGCRVVMAATDEALSGGKYAGGVETFVSALAGCAVHEIIEGMINRDHKDVKNINVEVSGIRRPTAPTLFDTLHVTFTLEGTLDDTYAGEVIRDIMLRRCPVAASFGRASYLTWEHHIV
jgi:uncharacterized OsmC-like protein